MSIYHLDVDQTWHTSNCAGDDWGVYTYAVDLLAWYTGQSEIKYVPWDMSHSSLHCHAPIFNARTKRNWEKRQKTQKQGDQLGKERFCPLSQQGTKGQVSYSICPPGSFCRQGMSYLGWVCVFNWGFRDFFMFNLISVPSFNEVDSDQEWAAVSKRRVDGLSSVHNVSCLIHLVQTDAASVKYKPAAPNSFCSQKQTLSWKAAD